VAIWPHGGVGFQDARQKGPVPAAHINECGDAGKIVGRYDGFGVLTCHVGLVLIEERRRFRVLLQIFEERDAEHVVERGLSCSDSVEESTGRLPKKGIAIEHRRATQRSGRVASERLSERCKLKTALRGFCEDPEAREGAEDPIEHSCINAENSGHVITRPGT